MARGTILSVNVGGVREFDYHGRPAESAIWKSSVTGRVAARGVNLAGDDQADRKVHGGPDKAVYAYAIEDTRWWGKQLGRSLEHGEFGENLSTEGIDVTNAIVGELWEVGSAVFEVSEPRVPCWRLGVRMNDERFPRRFTEAGRPGTYLRIVAEGDVGAGDEVRVVDRPEHVLVELKLSGSQGITREHFEPGQDVFRQGDLGDRLYIILSGRAELVCHSEDGETVLARLGPGEYFGEMALLQETTRKATVKCVSSMDVLSLPKREFVTLAAHLPDLRQAFERLKEERAEECAAGPPEARPTSG